MIPLNSRVGIGKLADAVPARPRLPTRPRRSSQRPSAAPPVRALLDRLSSRQTQDDIPGADSIVIPLNYAHLLGLRGREIYLDPIITAAHDDAFTNELDPAFSSVARLGKEKLLYAAREGLRSVRGRASLVHPDIHIEPALLPGALALLEQSGEYELVIQLSQQASSVNPRNLRPAPSRSTLRDYERDVALATALAHCGLAKGALEAGQVALGCARLEESLNIIQEATQPGENPLGAELQQQITNALKDLKADAVLDYLRHPLDLAEVALRQQALAALSKMMKQRSPSSDNGAVSSIGSGLSTEFVSQALAALSAEEICGVLDWEKLAKDASARSELPWWTQGVLPQAGLTHLVAGFANRRPALIDTARRLLAAGRGEGDVAVPMAVCEVLLGQPMDALEILKEDEHMGASLRNKAGLSAGGSAAHRRTARSAASGAAPQFPDRDGVMEYIRAASPDGESDLLPGLCLFVEQWMTKMAFPQLRDSRERPPSSSLSEYFDDPRTAAYLEARDKPSSLQAIGGAIAAAATNLQKSVVAGGRAVMAATFGQQRVGALLLGAAALVSALAVATGGFGLTTRRRATAQAPGGLSAAAAAAARNTNAVAGQRGSTSTNEAALSKEAAKSLVTNWLAVKAEAMGPRHTTNRLASVLAEPALSAVTAEAREAAAAGWFWQIRPLKVRIDAVDTAALTPEGGYAVVVATVDESADLWATNGKKGDSYATTYKVEYTLVRSKGGWRIAAALVLGR